MTGPAGAARAALQRQARPARQPHLAQLRGDPLQPRAYVAEGEARPAGEVDLGGGAERAQVAPGQLSQRGVAVVRPARRGQPVHAQHEARLGALVGALDGEPARHREADDVKARARVERDPLAFDPLAQLRAGERPVGGEGSADRLLGAITSDASMPSWPRRRRDQRAMSGSNRGRATARRRSRRDAPSYASPTCAAGSAPRCARGPRRRRSGERRAPGRRACRGAGPAPGRRRPRGRCRRGGKGMRGRCRSCAAARIRPRRAPDRALTAQAWRIRGLSGRRRARVSTRCSR